VGHSHLTTNPNFGFALIKNEGKTFDNSPHKQGQGIGAIFLKIIEH